MKIIATRPIPVDKDAIRKVVSAIVRELPSHLRFRPDDMDNPLWMARGFQKDRWGFYPNVPDVLITRPWLDEPIGLPEGSWPDTVDVRGVGVSAMLRLTAKSDPRATPDGPRYYVFGGHVKGNVGTPTNPKRYVEPDNVEVFINSSRTPNELLGNLDKVGRELYSVLIHEATHVRDLVRTKPAQYGVDPKAYYNEPSEVRAFMQQVADEVIEAIGAPELATGFMVTKAIQHSKTWNRIEPHLNASNRRLLLRGIGTAVMDARIVNRVASAWLHDARRLTGVR